MKQHYLLLALTEAAKGKGQCAPNPAVGAVIVKNNTVIATGYHKGPGLPHAEVEAITKLADKECEGAEIYVTLEPCSHYGRTPPCADLLIEKKFKAVYFGYLDPNPLVAGTGADRIKTAGIHCEHFEVPEINYFYKSYAHWTKTKKPFIMAKIAMSLDGKIALADGSPIKLTGPEADVYTHEQRRLSDGILSSSKTVMNDNAKFNARTADGIYQKKLFLLDRQLALPSTAEVFNTTESITLFHETGASLDYEHDKLTLIQCETTDSGLKLEEVITYLGQLGLHEVWLEVGAQALNSFIEANLLNKLIIYTCPILLGSKALNGFRRAHNLPKPSWQRLGSDIMAQFEFG